MKCDPASNESLNLAQNFPAVLFIMFYQVVQTFESEVLVLVSLRFLSRGCNSNF